MTQTNRIKEMRKKQGLSQRQLADVAGVTRQAISNYETDDRKPAVDIAQMLAAALGARVDEVWPPAATSEAPAN